jgi:hypothetical protein
MVSVALDCVENCPEEFTRTVTVWLFDTVPGALVNAPPPIEYSPPVMEIGAAVLMPVMVTWFDATAVDGADPV